MIFDILCVYRALAWIFGWVGNSRLVQKYAKKHNYAKWNTKFDIRVADIKTLFFLMNR
ncbi:MAG: hypothetical protein MI747_01565 [Desulfobacterales bacterium]|nr:hypothetical protein [Desulfobacterales bacterium]